VSETLLRIGELSRRSGASPELLRAWERRYGLLQPQRSGGGTRLYTLADLERVRRMRGHLAAGVAAAEAARLAAAEPAATAAPATLDPGLLRTELAAALDAFDEQRAHAVLDRALADATTETVLVQVVLPYLHDLGARWERGEASVAQEHFASGILRGRLLGLARGWGLGVGPLALVACLPGEQHELGAIAFGLALRSRGWRIAWLGADTPLETVAAAARDLDPALVVLSTVSPERLAAAAPEVQALVRERRVALGGSGVDAGAAEHLGATALDGSIAAAAERASTLLA
jgi:DNA-binding transcriptional MerR regulator